MPANQRPQPAQPSASPIPKASSKYANRDGSKTITIPKAITPTHPSETSPAMAQTTTKPNGQMPIPPANTNGTAAQGVNRKKQKRREKEKAKLAAQQPPNMQTNGNHASSSSTRQMDDLEQRFHNHGLQESYRQNGQFDSPDADPYDTDEADDGYSGSYGQNGSPTNGYAIPPPARTTKNSKGKKKARKIPENPPERHSSHPVHNGLSSPHVPLPISSLAPTDMPRGPGISKEKIWNTSSQEERERIKEFWLSLGEDERKSLVKVEKDAVLKKMKEQQKHSCSCTVCGRKRTAIEEELEVLYDAYYEELEQYANHQGDGGPPPMMPPPRRFGPLSGLASPHRLPPAFNGQQPSRGRIVEQIGEDDEEDEEDDDEEYDDGEGDEEDEFSDEEEPEELPRTHATDFFNFGNSLTVQGGILTVADDLLKNDGKKFIEMMEQLAERRMAREEDAREQYSNPSYGHPPNGSMHNHSHNHSHPPPVDDTEYGEEEEEEEDDEYESGEEDDYDEDEEMVSEGSSGEAECSNSVQDTMTEEQRMEEGRRMFQIFAARMFEQRVLTAYKEKVAKERQVKLLEEIAEDEAAVSQKKAKKAKDAQRKKEKMAQKKQLLAEEKAKKEADKAAEEAAAREAEQKKVEEQRQKAEEKRKKKEAQKKAEEEERLRKEAEKQKRLQEQRDRQAELERKQRESKERERKEKEELRQKEKEAKEIKEREVKERKERQEREKREREAKAKADKEAKEKQARDELVAQKAVAQAANAATLAAKRAQPPVPIPANLQSHPTVSPHIPFVTPAVPKAPTPIKVRSTSSQHENASLPATPQNAGQSQNVSPVPLTPLQGSPGLLGSFGKHQNQPHLHHPQATSPMHAAIKNPPGFQSLPFGNASPQNFGHQQYPPGMQFGRPPHEQLHSYPHPNNGQFRQIPPPNNMQMPPMYGMHGGRGAFPPQHPPPGFGQQITGNLAALFNAVKENGTTQSHSRQHSGTFDSAPGPAQPIARPAPIGRPASVVHGQHHNDARSHDVETLSHRLGSSALLDDSDEPITPGGNARRPSAAPGNIRQPFPQVPYGLEGGGFGNSMMFGGNTWGTPNVFGSGSQPGAGGFWPQSHFGPMGGNQPMRPIQSRPVAVRLLVCNSFKSLNGSPDGFYDILTIKEQIERHSPHELPISEQEILLICETEGNASNGGGTFDIREDISGHTSVRYERDVESAPRQMEIGSPIVGSGVSRFHGPPPPGF